MLNCRLHENQVNKAKRKGVIVEELSSKTNCRKFTGYQKKQGAGLLGIPRPTNI